MVAVNVGEDVGFAAKSLAEGAVSYRRQKGGCHCVDTVKESE